MPASQFIKNGQQLTYKTGFPAVNQGDLLQIGGPGNEIYSVKTSDYARTATASTLLASTSVVANAFAGYSRQPVVTDSLGNIYVVGRPAGGSGIQVTKTSPLGVVLNTVTLDATADAMVSPILVPLQLASGAQSNTFSVIYADSTTYAAKFVVFDAALNIVAGPTTVATAYHSGSVVYLDACPLANGGFAVTYQTAAGTSVQIATYSNVGAVVTASFNAQTLAGTPAQEFLHIGQLSSGNLVVSYRGTMTAGAVAGTSFNIVTAVGGAVAGPISVDNASTAGFFELSIMAGFFAIAVPNGTNLKAGIYSNAAGALQGSQYSVADTLNLSTCVQTKLLNDGVQFWLVYIGSGAAGVNVVQLPTTGTGYVATTGFSSNTVSSTFSLDVAYSNNLLMVLTASTLSGGQYWLTIGLPDSFLGTTAPYLRTGATQFGAPALTGSCWPRVLSSGDFTGIFVFDQQGAAGTYLGVQKVEASAIVGVSQGPSVAAGNPGYPISVATGPGNMPINAIAGSINVSFDHTASTPAGNVGVLANNGVSFGATTLVGGLTGGATSGGSSSSSSGSSTGIAGVAVAANNLVQLAADGSIYPCQTSDFATVANAGTAILAATSLTNYPAYQAYGCNSNNPGLLVDSAGYYYILTSVSGNGLTVVKYTPLGALVSSVGVTSISNYYSYCKMFFLSNGNICCTQFIGNGGAGGYSSFCIINPATMTQVVAPTTMTGAGAGYGLDACPLLGGGFAAVYPNGSSSVQFTVYNNAGAQQATTTFSALGAYNTDSYAISQLSNGNCAIIDAYVASTGAINLVIFNTAATQILAPTTVSSILAKVNNYQLNASISVVPGYFCITGVNTNSIASGVFTNGGALQGAVYTQYMANSGISPSVVNDGVNFWTSCANSSYYLQITKLTL